MHRVFTSYRYRRQLRDEPFLWFTASAALIFNSINAKYESEVIAEGNVTFNSSVRDHRRFFHPQHVKVHIKVQHSVTGTMAVFP